MSKFYRIGIILMLCLTMVLAGCTSGGDSGNADTGNNEESSENANESENVEDGVGLTEPGQFPIVKNKVELNVLVRGDARIEDFETNAFTKWYEDLTNVKINFQVAPEDSVAETLNLRLASGDYPDIILNMGVSRSQEMIYGQQGVFVPLNDLIETQGHFINQMFTEKPEYKEAIVAPDGNIYSLPEINECYHCSLSVKMWMYQPWLDKLGLKMPTTTEEYYQVLKAFKEQDPNGNGIADEIPLAGTTKSWNANVEMFLMNSFIYTPPERMFVDDSGKVQVSFDKPEWKAGLQYLNKLYSDGLLAGESFTQDEQQLRQLGENPDAPILGSYAAGWFGIGIEYGGPSERWKGYTSVNPLEGPSGTRQAVSFPYQFSSGKFVITNASKYPEVAFRWADGMYSEEVNLHMNGGVPGEDWEEAKPGDVGIDGRPAKWVALTEYGRVQNNQWYQAGPSFTSEDYRLSWSAGEKPEENLEVILFNQSKSNYEPYRKDIKNVLPPLFFTEEQSTELADLEKTIKDYVDQMTARFITGDADIEAEWETYLATLEGMNLARFIEIRQESLDSRK